MRAAKLAALVVLLAAGACSKTTYVAYDGANDPVPLIERQVRYEVSDALYQVMPRCAIVMPATGTDSPDLAGMAERAVARRLADKIERVVGPDERDDAVRRMVVALDHDGDRRYFAASLGCETTLHVSLFDSGETYLLVWSQRRMGYEAELRTADDGLLLWRARHVARRSDGGVPLSPASVGVAAVTAGAFRQDGDIIPSMVDDVARRLFATFPNLR